MAHRSYSVQQVTPMSPRVILFGAAANVIMTFNAGINRAGHKMAGGKSIDILE
jgi:hypothetical protein